MRSEDDIREALEALADTAPDADDVLARVRARERGERRTALHTPVLVGISALATAAAAFVVPLAIDLPDPDVPAASETSAAPRNNPRWQYSFSLELPGDYAVQSWSITPEYQAAKVLTPSGTSCWVVVYEPYVFEPKWIQAKHSAVSLSSGTGYIAEIAPAQGLPGGLDPHIVWQYSPQMWATTACAPTGEEQVVAEAVRQTPRRLPLPFRIGYLPDEVVAYSAGELPGPSSVSRLVVNTSRDLPKKPTVNSANGPRLTIEFRQGNSTPPGSSRLSVAGRQALLQRSKAAAELLVHLDSYEVVLTADDALADQELVKVAQKLEFAPDLSDESTWFDGTVAIP